MFDVGSAIGYLMLDTTGFKQGFADANSYLSAFFDNTRSTADRINDIQDGMTKLGSTMSKSVTLPLVGAGTAMVGFAASSESAFAKFKGQVGEVTGSLEDYKDTMEEIYEANYGDSYEDVADSMALIVQRLGEMDPSNLEEVTESALALRDTMGYEVNESIRTVDTLMKNFGMTSKDAFDFIVKGTQEGLDFSGEFLDTINEYSVQFTKVGLSANDMFSILKAGVESGSWNLDKVGDAIKEFSIRAIDGSDTTIDAFNRLGMSYEEVGTKFAEGGDAAKEAFQDVIKSIESIQDPLEQDLVGVELFGTMWEDLGKDVIFQMGNISDSAVEMKGAMDSLKETRVDTLQSSLSELWRTIQGGAASFGELLIPRIQQLTEFIQGLIDGFENLDPRTKEFIVNLGVAAAAFGPLMLVAGKLTSAINAGITTFRTFKTALTAATAAQNGLNASMAANPVGLLVTGVGMLIAVLGSFAISAALATNETSKLSTEIEEARGEYEKLSEEIEENNTSTMGMVAALEQLVAQENKTAAEKETIKQLVDDLNEAVPELSLAYDEQTNSLNMTTEAIKAAAKAEYDRAKQQAAIERISEAYTEQIRIAEQLEEAQALLEKEQKRYTEATENSTAQTSRQKDAMQAYTGALYYAQGEVDRLTKLQQENEAEIAELEGAYSGYAYVVSTDVKQASVNLINQSGREKAAINDTTEAIELKIKALLALAQADEKSAMSAIASGGIDPIKLATNTALLAKAKSDIAAYTKALNDLKNAEAEVEDNDDDGTGTGGYTGIGGKVSRELTQAEKDLEAYTEAVKELDHLRTMERISEESYYEEKGKLAEKYLNKESSEYMGWEEERYNWEKEQQKKLLEQRTEAYEDQRDQLKEQYDNGEITTEQYLKELNRIQSEYLDEGTDEWVDALEFRNEEAERIQEEFVDAFVDSLDTIGEEYADAMDEVGESQKKLADKLSDTELFEVEDGRMFLKDIGDGIDEIERYGDSLEKLRERGISESLLSEILDMDVDDASQYMAALLKMTDEDFEEYNKSWEEKQRIAQEIAKEFYADQIDTIKTDFVDEITGVMSEVPDTMSDAGKEAVGAWMDGFESEFGSIAPLIRGLFDQASVAGSEAGASVRQSMSLVSGSYASGLDYVPRDMNVRVHEGESIWTKQATAELANMLNASNSASGDLVINWYINGTKFARAIIPDFRTVDASTPKVVSDN